MRNRIFQRLALFIVTALLSGCVVLPLLPFLPVMGSAYQGYVVWKSGKAIKYYAYDLDTTYRAVMQAANQLKLDATLIRSESQEEYSMETKGTVPMHIDILPFEKSVSVTKVVIKISLFGDKQYVELFYRLIDYNLPSKQVIDKAKAQ